MKYEVTDNNDNFITEIKEMKGDSYIDGMYEKRYYDYYDDDEKLLSLPQERLGMPYPELKTVLKEKYGEGLKIKLVD